MTSHTDVLGSRDEVKYSGFKYTYKYLDSKCKYKYLKLVLEYYSSTSTQYYISANKQDANRNRILHT